MMDLEKKQLDEVMLFIKETDGNELYLEIGEMRLRLKKGGDISLFRIQPVDRDSVGKNQALEEEVISVTSPSVGIFYSRSEPDAHPYVEVGSFVEEGDIIEIDIPGKRLTLKVDQETLDRRKSTWTVPPPKIKEGYVYRYAQMVTSASTGAVFKS